MKDINAQSSLIKLFVKKDNSDYNASFYQCQEELLPLNTFYKNIEICSISFINIKLNKNILSM